MTEFTVRIAGCAIAIRAMNPQMKDLFRDYLTDEPPMMTIECTADRLLTERALIKRHDPDNRLSDEDVSDDRVEFNFFYRETAERLAEWETVLIHASAVAVDGKAYLFVAPSGTGKSTHVRLWREYFGSRAVTVNDDKPLLQCAGNEILVCGSPWNGKHRLGANIAVPLSAICFLERGEKNHIERIDAKSAFLPMLKAVYHSETAAREACILQSLQRIRRRTAFYRLRCTVEPEAAAVAYEGMREVNRL